MIVILMRTKYREKTLEFLKNLFPPVRRVTEKMSSARVAGILGLMLSSGFPMDSALEMAPAALTDQTISDFIIGNTAVSFTAKELADYAEITDKLSLLYKKLLWLYPFLKDLPPETAAHAIKKLAEEAGDDPENTICLFRSVSFF